MIAAVTVKIWEDFSSCIIYDIPRYIPVENKPPKNKITTQLQNMKYRLLTIVLYPPPPPNEYQLGSLPEDRREGVEQ